MLDNANELTLRASAPQRSHRKEDSNPVDHACALMTQVDHGNSEARMCELGWSRKKPERFRRSRRFA